MLYIFNDDYFFSEKNCDDHKTCMFVNRFIKFIKMSANWTIFMLNNYISKLRGLLHTSYIAQKSFWLSNMLCREIAVLL